MGWDIEFSFQKISTASLIFEVGESECTEESKLDTKTRERPFFYATNDDVCDRLSGCLVCIHALYKHSLTFILN